MKSFYNSGQMSDGSGEDFYWESNMKNWYLLTDELVYICPEIEDSYFVNFIWNPAEPDLSLLTHCKTQTLSFSTKADEQ